MWVVLRVKFRLRNNNVLRLGDSFDVNLFPRLTLLFNQKESQYCDTYHHQYATNDANDDVHIQVGIFDTICINNSHVSSLNRGLWSSDYDRNLLYFWHHLVFEDGFVGSSPLSCHTCRRIRLTSSLCGCVDSRSDRDWLALSCCA
jgi:hypothetical protein